MNARVDIQSASVEPVPKEEDIRSWVNAALADRIPRRNAELTVRMVDREEMAALNLTYRGKPGTTNVLSFPADLPADVDVPLLGDIVICAPVVHSEASEQGKSRDAHWAHMTVHGVLHLLGHDHIQEDEATVMEALETTILKKLNYDCPYTNQGQREPTQ